MTLNMMMIVMGFAACGGLLAGGGWFVFERARARKKPGAENPMPPDADQPESQPTAEAASEPEPDADVREAEPDAPAVMAEAAPDEADEPPPDQGPADPDLIRRLDELQTSVADIARAQLTLIEQADRATTAQDDLDGDADLSARTDALTVARDELGEMVTALGVAADGLREMAERAVVSGTDDVNAGVDAEEISERFAALDSRIGALAALLPNMQTTLESALETTRRELSEGLAAIAGASDAPDGPGSASGDRFDGLETAIVALATQISQLADQQAVQAPEQDPRFDAIAEQLANLEKVLEATSGATSDQAQMVDRMDRLESLLRTAIDAGAERPAAADPGPEPVVTDAEDAPQILPASPAPQMSEPEPEHPVISEADMPSLDVADETPAHPPDPDPMNGPDIAAASGEDVPGDADSVLPDTQDGQPEPASAPPIAARKATPARTRPGGAMLFARRSRA